MPVFEFNFEPVFPEQSVKTVLEQFVTKVDEMDSTVLVPSRLMDMSTEDISKTGEFPTKDIDLRAAYSTLKILSSELKEGYYHLNSEDLLGLNNLQENIRHFLIQIMQLTFCAKTLKERYQYVINNAGHDSVLELNQFKKQIGGTGHTSLIEALRNFVEEVADMEREILFPVLLEGISLAETRDFTSVIDMTEAKTGYDLFLRIKAIKKQLLCGLDKQQLNPFCTLMKSIFHGVQDCTSLANLITERYQQEIQGF